MFTNSLEEKYTSEPPRTKKEIIRVVSSIPANYRLSEAAKEHSFCSALLHRPALEASVCSSRRVRNITGAAGHAASRNSWTCQIIWARGAEERAGTAALAPAERNTLGRQSLLSWRSRTPGWTGEVSAKSFRQSLLGVVQVLDMWCKTSLYLSWRNNFAAVFKRMGPAFLLLSKTSCGLQELSPEYSTASAIFDFIYIYTHINTLLVAVCLPPDEIVITKEPYQSSWKLQRLMGVFSSAMDFTCPFLKGCVFSKPCFPVLSADKLSVRVLMA